MDRAPAKLAAWLGKWMTLKSIWRCLRGAQTDNHSVRAARIPQETFMPGGTFVVGGLEHIVVRRIRAEYREVRS